MKSASCCRLFAQLCERCKRRANRAKESTEQMTTRLLFNSSELSWVLDCDGCGDVMMDRYGDSTTRMRYMLALCIKDAPDPKKNSEVSWRAQTRVKAKRQRLRDMETQRHRHRSKTWLVLLSEPHCNRTDSVASGARLVSGNYPNRHQRTRRLGIHRARLLPAGATATQSANGQRQKF